MVMSKHIQYPVDKGSKNRRKGIKSRKSLVQLMVCVECEMRTFPIRHEMMDDQPKHKMEKTGTEKRAN